MWTKVRLGMGGRPSLRTVGESYICPSNVGSGGRKKKKYGKGNTKHRENVTLRIARYDGGGGLGSSGNLRYKGLLGGTLLKHCGGAWHKKG